MQYQRFCESVWTVFPTNSKDRDAEHLLQQIRHVQKQWNESRNELDQQRTAHEQLRTVGNKCIAALVTVSVRKNRV